MRARELEREEVGEMKERSYGNETRGGPEVPCAKAVESSSKEKETNPHIHGLEEDGRFVVHIAVYGLM